MSELALKLIRENIEKHRPEGRSAFLDPGNCRVAECRGKLDNCKIKRIFETNFFQKMKTATTIKGQKIPPRVRIFKKGEEPDDIFYWLSRPPIERIRALEEIRKQYNDWKYGAGPEFQRVYSIVKRKRG